LCHIPNVTLAAILKKVNGEKFLKLNFVCPKKEQKISYHLHCKLKYTY
jgi:hypothetical protein